MTHPDSLIEDLRRFMVRDVPTETAQQALFAAREMWPNATGGWLIGRAAVVADKLIRYPSIAQEVEMMRQASLRSAQGQRTGHAALGT